jgi:poly-gamma-glutamate capsule biosynthesis protein CapA/YwtB (metallophosphatase superfamily)
MPAGVVLCLVGDVMTGRGVDQILPTPGEPRLWESYVRDATRYVELAEAVSGPIVRPVDVAWPWGDALTTMDTEAPDARIVNLETSVTTCSEPRAGKAVHYRMHPANVGCLTVARPDACVLANNHVLDFGPRGLVETLDTLDAAGLTRVGAGRDEDEAWRPALLEAGDHRVLLWAAGAESSGVPRTWAAAPARPGVAFVDLTSAEADAIGERVREVKRPGDVAVLSIHWGSNWGYDVSRRQVRFAHRLVDHGVDVVFGHSSHHPRPVEVYHGGLVLYGCGDFIDDYEGIGGHEEFRDDLRLLHLVRVVPGEGVQDLRMVPFRVERMRLLHASRSDAAWLGDVLTEAGRRFGTRVEVAQNGSLVLADVG